MVSLCMCTTALVYRIWQEVYGPYYTVLSKYPHLKESKFVTMKTQLFIYNKVHLLLRRYTYGMGRSGNPL